MRISNTLLDQVKHNRGKTNELIVKRGEEINEIKIQKLVSAFRLNITITKLDLSNTAIDDTSIYILANLLTFPKTVLENLILQGNLITDIGASKLADALKINHSLKLLNLENNYIGNKGGCGLAEALIDNRSLETLNIFANDDIGTDTLFAIAKALPKCSLKSLALDGLDDPSDDETSEADSTSDGWEALVKAMKENHTLTDIGIANTYETKYEEVLPFLNRNVQMKILCSQLHASPIFIYNSFLKNNLPIEFPSLYLLTLSTVITNFTDGKIKFSQLNTLSSEILEKFTPRFTPYLLSLMAKYDNDGKKNTTTNTNIINYAEDPNKFFCKKRKISEQTNNAIKFSQSTTFFSQNEEKEDDTNQNHHKKRKTFKLSTKIDISVIRKGDKNEEPLPITPFYVINPNNFVVKPTM